MKKILFVIIICLLLLTGCTKKITIDNNKKKGDTKMSDIKVIINDKTYTAKLEDNKTAKEFVDILPQEFTMNDLNDNEKYVYLNNSLTTNSYKPKQIEKGDIMIFGDNCLVIFYKSFDTSYSYTKIGHIDNLDIMEKESINVIFEK